MKIIGRERLNRQDIEERAAQLLRHFRSDFLDFQQPTPLREIATFLSQKHQITFDYTRTLGFSDNGERIIGAFNPRKRVILIDASLQSDEHKFHFTLAHEFGHLALHRKVKVLYENTDPASKETVLEGDDEAQGYESESDWLEWQANAYASSLLMPELIFKSALISVQKELGIGRQGRIFVDHQPVNLGDYYQIIAQLSSYFSVSKTAVEYRLHKLGLVEDHRPMRSVKDILRQKLL